MKNKKNVTPCYSCEFSSTSWGRETSTFALHCSSNRLAPQNLNRYWCNSANFHRHLDGSPNFVQKMLLGIFCCLAIPYTFPGPPQPVRNTYRSIDLCETAPVVRAEKIYSWNENIFHFVFNTNSGHAHLQCRPFDSIKPSSRTNANEVQHAWTKKEITK